METKEQKVVKFKHVLIIVGIVLLFQLANFFMVNNKDKKEEELNKQLIISQEKVKNLEEAIKTKDIEYDSIKTIIMVKDAIIENQKNNPQIIKEKYEKIRTVIVGYNVDESIEFLSDHIFGKDSIRR